MNFLRKLRVGSRLAIGFGALAVVIIGFGAFAYSRLQVATNALEHMDSGNKRTDLTKKLADITNDNARVMVQFFVLEKPEARAAMEKALIDGFPKYLAALTQLREGTEDERERKIIYRIAGYGIPYWYSQDVKREMLKVAGRNAGLDFSAATNSLRNSHFAAIEELYAAELKAGHDATHENVAFFHKSQIVTGVAVCVAILLAIGAGLVITRSITRPLLAAVSDADEITQGRFAIQSQEELGQVSEAFGYVKAVFAETVALKQNVETENRELQAQIMELLTVVANASEGDLTVRARVTSGTLGNVADAFNSLLESLQVVLTRVREQIRRTNQTVNQIAASSNRMANGATTQAMELKNAKALVEQTTEDIKRVGQAAESAAGAARNTESSANEGATAIQNIISGMEQLRQNVQAGAKKMKILGDRSMEITGIVDTIGRISEQTNMLALNAAIEAARAGEHGRGFSVVAEEVRKLAERAATATQEIGKLVAAISNETNETVAAIEKQTQVVEQESELVARAGQALIRIREESSDSASLVSGITTLTEAQIEGSATVAKAINEIAQVAQATLQGVQGTVSTLGQLTQLSTELTQSIARFKVHSTGEDIPRAAQA
jgi:methyl-accepting chemotaxis protein